MKTCRTCVLLSALLFFLPSCHSTRYHNQKTREGSLRLGITPEQYQRFEKYLKHRKTFTNLLRLPHKATAEEIRSSVAGELKVPKDSSWEALLKHDTIKHYLTEERRTKFTVMFGLETNTSWIVLKDHLEKLREQELGSR